MLEDLTVGEDLTCLGTGFVYCCIGFVLAGYSSEPRRFPDPFMNCKLSALFLGAVAIGGIGCSGFRGGGAAVRDAGSLEPGVAAVSADGAESPLQGIYASAAGQPVAERPPGDSGAAVAALPSPESVVPKPRIVRASSRAEERKSFVNRWREAKDQKKEYKRQMAEFKAAQKLREKEERRQAEEDERLAAELKRQRKQAEKLAEAQADEERKWAREQEKLAEREFKRQKKALKKSGASEYALMIPPSKPEAGVSLLNQLELDDKRKKREVEILSANRRYAETSSKRKWGWGWGWGKGRKGGASSGRKMNVRTTAYTHTESDHVRYKRKNAVGTRLKYGKVKSAASDWSRFPLGTKFKIKGENSTYVIDDYGSALVGTNTIDLYRPSKTSMRRWGARHVDIQIMEWGSYDQSLKVMKPRTKYRHVREMVDDIQKKKKGSGLTRS